MAAAVVLTTTDVFSLVNTESEGSALLRLHDSLLQDILRRTDLQSRVKASAACRRLARVSAEHPPSVVDLSSDGVHPEACRRYIERAKGAIVTLTTARHQQRTACDATSARRFNTGVRCTQVVPYTRGPSAGRLAAALPNLQHLALHEAASCLGGMTDEFAVAVAANCPQLSSLEVAFTRYSLPSEFFTDAGMMALAAGCPRLRCLSLTNCGAITDRSLYAVAVHCRGLRSLALGGYHELISDYGTVVLFQACSGLERVVLSGKLRRVTDESVEALVATSGAVLREVKLTRSMGDRSLAALAAHCGELRMVDCCKCEPGAVTAEGVAAMLTAVSAKAAAAAPGAAPPPPPPPQQQHEHAQLPAGPSPEAAAAQLPRPAAAKEAEHHCSTCECSHTPGVIRVVLPRGLGSADVVRHAPGGESGAAAARWRAVSSAPPGTSSSMTTAAGAAVAGAGAGFGGTGVPPGSACLATVRKVGTAAGAGAGSGSGGSSRSGSPPGGGGGGAAAAAEVPFGEVLVLL